MWNLRKMSLHVLRQKIKVFYCDSSTSCEAKSLRQKIKVYLLLLCAQCKIIEEKQDCSPTQSEMESFRIITYGFLLLK